MSKVYYLATCNTCQRIIKELDLPESFTLQDIKSNPISEEQLTEMRQLSGSYENLFSRRARKYKELEPKPNSEEDYKQLLLEEYTFLKRPVVLHAGEIFIGNSKKTQASLAEKIQ